MHHRRIHETDSYDAVRPGQTKKGTAHLCAVPGFYSQANSLYLSTLLASYMENGPIRTRRPLGRVGSFSIL